MIKKLSKISLTLCFALFFASLVSPAQAAPKLTKVQQAQVASVFKAIATSNPDAISSARSKTTGVANLSLLVIQNFYSTEKYIRSIDSVGRPLGITPANAALGKARVTAGKVVLETAAPGFAGTYTDFKFTKAGKIVSWSISSSGGTKVNIAQRIKALPTVTWQYANDIKAVYWGNGVQMDSGIYYQDSQGRWVVQLAVTNVAGGNNTKSLIATTGKYQSPDKKLYDTISTQVTCFGTGQTVYITSTIPAGAIILSGIIGILEIPMSNGCIPDDSNRLLVKIKP
jgi:hypothetical protein